MEYKEYSKSQNTRFAYIIEYIKKTNNISQIDIANELNISTIDETRISKLKKETKKKLPNELITELHKKYNVNPDFLLLKSDCPFDTIGIMLEHFESFIDDWKVANGQNEKCLHLRINSNFYDFLLELYKLKEIKDNGIIDYEKSKNDLQEVYNGDPLLKDYLLIPRECLTEIVQSEMENINVDGILNFLDYKDCIDE